MNARDWLGLNEGKKIQLIRRFMGNRIEKNLGSQEPFDEVGDVIKKVTVREFWWELCLDNNFQLRFFNDELGDTKDNVAVILSRTMNGNIFLAEFTLVD